MAKEDLQKDRLAALLRELEAEHGPIDQDALEAARRAWQAPDYGSGQVATSRSHRS